MTPLDAALVAIVAAGAAGTIVAERVAPSYQWVAKPAASLAFVALGVAHHASAPVLAALALALVGDVLLIPTDAPRVFRAGIVAFFLAHVAFLVEFASRAPIWSVALAALMPLALVAWLVARRIVPRAAASLRPAIVAYVVVITTMVALAAGASAGPTGPRWLVVAALAFWTNDLLVARERFVISRAWHRAVGLPLYYTAMVAFALA